MLPEPGEPQLLALLRREKLPHRSIEEALSTIARRQARIGALYSIDEDLRRAGMAPGPIDDRATEREDSRIATRTSRRDG
jgi:hypothetical protein